MQPGWGDAADYFSERHTTYSNTESNIPAVVQQQMADNAVSSAPMTLGEPMEILDSTPGKSQM